VGCDKAIGRDAARLTIGRIDHFRNTPEL